MPRIIKRRPGDPCCSLEPCLFEWLVEPTTFDRGETIEAEATKPLIETIDGEPIESHEYQLVTTIEAVDQFKEIEGIVDEAENVAADLSPTVIDFAAISDHVAAQADALSNSEENSEGQLDPIVAELEVLAGDIGGLSGSYDTAKAIAERDLAQEIAQAFGKVIVKMPKNAFGFAGRDHWIVNEGDGDELLALVEALRDSLRSADEAFSIATSLADSIVNLEALNQLSGSRLQGDAQEFVDKVNAASEALADYESLVENLESAVMPTAVWVSWYGLEVSDAHTRAFCRAMPDNVEDYHGEPGDLDAQVKSAVFATEILENEAPWAQQGRVANVMAITQKQYKATHSIKHPEQNVADDPESRDLVMREVVVGSGYLLPYSHICKDYDEGAGSLPVELPTISISLPNNGVKKYRVQCKRTPNDPVCFPRPVRHKVPFSYRRWRYTAQAYTTGQPEGLVARDARADFDLYTGLHCCLRHTTKDENFSQFILHLGQLNGESKMAFVGTYYKNGNAASAPHFLYSWEEIDQNILDTIYLETGDPVYMRRPVAERPMNESQWWDSMSKLAPAVPRIKFDQETAATIGYRYIGYLRERQSEPGDCTGAQIGGINWADDDYFYAQSVDTSYFHGNPLFLGFYLPIGAEYQEEIASPRFKLMGSLTYVDGREPKVVESYYLSADDWLALYVFEPHVVESPDGERWVNPQFYFNTPIVDADGDAYFDPLTEGYEITYDHFALDASNGYTFSVNGCRESSVDYRVIRSAYSATAGVRKTWSQQNQIV